jgi:hypothetical protein
LARLARSPLSEASVGIREPDAVGRDLREQKVTAEAARAVYGVVIENGAVNAAATAAERDHQRARRRERSRIPRDTGGKADLTSARRLDDNLVETAAPDRAGTVVACRHCAEILGGTAADAELAGGRAVPGRPPMPRRSRRRDTSTSDRCQEDQKS